MPPSKAFAQRIFEFLEASLRDQNGTVNPGNSARHRTRIYIRFGGLKEKVPPFGPALPHGP